MLPVYYSQGTGGQEVRQSFFWTINLSQQTSKFTSTKGVLFLYNLSKVDSRFFLTSDVKIMVD